MEPAEVKEAVAKALPPSDLTAPLWLVHGYGAMENKERRIAQLEAEVFAPIERAIALGEQRAYTEP